MVLRLYFSSAILYSLELKHLSIENCPIFPSLAFKGFDKLISLELRGIGTISIFLECLISHCPFLEQLLLHNLLTDERVIEINAPMLKSFEFTGNLSSICLKNIPLLEKLSLTSIDSFVGVRRCEVAKYLDSFSSLQHLHLNNNTLKFLAARAGVVPTRLPFNLDCVRRLYVSGINLGEFDAVSYFLCLIRSFPSLQFLQIEVSQM